MGSALVPASEETTATPPTKKQSTMEYRTLAFSLLFRLELLILPDRARRRRN